MSNEEYIRCILIMLKRIGSNALLKKIYDFVHRIFIAL